MKGLIGRKLGMTQVFDDDGALIPVTVIEFEPNVVIDSREPEKHGYKAVVLGAVEKKEKHVTKSYAGQFADSIPPKKTVAEIRDFDVEYKVGDSFGVELFESINFVDVIGTSKGKGYQGVMKRHNFHGGRKTHGSKFHRANGSTGMAAHPSRVLKGTKMPGRMGGERKTIQNLEIVRVDGDKQVLLVKGAVPGPRNSMVIVKKATKS